MANHCIALTYEPKIKGVCKGEIRQTIRKVGKRVYRVGDTLIFHGWSGRPYWSTWDWRLKGLTITEVYKVHIDNNGGVFKVIPELSVGPFANCCCGAEMCTAALNELARLDGIVPPTGEGLKAVLSAKNKSFEGDYWVLRWTPSNKVSE